MMKSVKRCAPIVSIILLFSIIISGIISNRTDAFPLEATGFADASNTSSMSPADRIKSYSYYKAILICAKDGAFNRDENGITDPTYTNLMADPTINDVAGQVRNVGYFVTANDTENDGKEQCRTVAEKAFNFWKFDTKDIASFLSSLGYTTSTAKEYTCQVIATVGASQNKLTTIGYNRISINSDNTYVLATEAESPTIKFTYPVEDTSIMKTDIDNAELFNSSDLNGDEVTDELDIIEYACRNYTNQNAPYDGTTGFSYIGGLDGTADYDGDGIKEYSAKALNGTKVTYHPSEASDLTSRLDAEIRQHVYKSSAEVSLDNTPGLKYYLYFSYLYSLSGVCKAVNYTDLSTIAGATNLVKIDPDKGVKNVKSDMSGIDTYNVTWGGSVSDLTAYPIYPGKTPSTGETCRDIITNLNAEADKFSTDFANKTTDKYKTIFSTLTAIPGESSTSTIDDPAGTVEEADSCGTQVPGVGWIMCPVLNGLVSLNDGVWRLVTGLLTVSPLQQKAANGSDSGAYVAWGMIRNIANIVFVIVFLVMIFSQLSSAGISNYGIKKLLPRLIVGAILVNISFLIVQLAVDLSNVIGNGLYGLIQGVTPYAPYGWATLFDRISIGAIGAAAAGAATLFVAGNATAFWMLLPIAAVGLLGLIAAIVTLVFRKAAIIILAIFAPLAIVASLLPNTESWFKKWKDEFIQLLMLYPLAAVIFGGSQFAASIIMSENPNSWFNNLMAMVITTLPLFSLPFLVTKGGKIMSTVGGALGKLAEKARSPLKNFAKSYEDEARSKYLAGDPSKARTGLGAARQNAYKRFSRQRMTRESNTKTNTMKFGSEWAGSTEGKEADNRALLAESQSKVDKTLAQQRMHNSTEGKTAIDLEKKTDTDLQTLKEEAGTRFSQSTDGTDALTRLGLAKKQTTVDSDAIATHTDNTATGRILNETISKGKLQSSIDSADTEHRVAASADGKILNETVSRGKLQSSTDSTDTENRVAASIAGKALHQALGETTQTSTQYKQAIAHDLATSVNGIANDRQIGVGKILAENDTLRTNVRVAQSTEGHDANIEQGELKIRSNTEDNKVATEVEKITPVDVRLGQKAAEADLKAAKSSTDLLATEAATSSTAAHLSTIDAATRATLQDAKRQSDLIAMASNNAQRVQQNELADVLIQDTATINGQSVREFAGGIDTEKGADSALANAIATKREAHNKVIGDRNQMFKHFNVDGANRQAISMGKQVRNKATGLMEDPSGTDADGTKYVFSLSDKNSQEAAIERQMEIGSYDEFTEIIEASGSTLSDFKTVIADAIPKYGINKKGPQYGGKIINTVSQGGIKGHVDMVRGAADFLKDGKFQAEDMANSDAGSLKTFIEASKTYKDIGSDGKPIMQQFNYNKDGEKIKEGDIYDNEGTKVTAGTGEVIDNYAIMEDRVEQLKKIATLVLNPETTVGKNRTDAATKQFKIMSEL